MCVNSCSGCGKSYAECECGTAEDRRKRNMQKFDEMKRITSKPGWEKPEEGQSADQQ